MPPNGFLVDQMGVIPVDFFHCLSLSICLDLTRTQWFTLKICPFCPRLVFWDHCCFSRLFFLIMQFFHYTKCDKKNIKMLTVKSHFWPFWHKKRSSVAFSICRSTKYTNPIKKTKIRIVTDFLITHKSLFTFFLQTNFVKKKI